MGYEAYFSITYFSELVKTHDIERYIDFTMPPSTSMDCPVANVFANDPRNSTTLASSSGCPYLPIGIIEIALFFASFLVIPRFLAVSLSREDTRSVSIRPGPTLIYCKVLVLWQCFLTNLRYLS